MITLRKPTPVAPCPVCHHPDGKWMPYTSALRKADSFCCPACGGIWQMDKPETEPRDKS